MLRAFNGEVAASGEIATAGPVAEPATPAAAK